MPKITVRDEAFNDLYKPLYSDQSRYLVLKGGGGSGKSEFAAQKFLLRSLKECGKDNTQAHRFFLIRKVGKTIRNSQFKLLKDQITRYGMQKLFHIKETDMSIICNLNGNEFISVGLDDREKMKSLTSPTGMWLEEPTELEPRDFRQLDIRLRGHTQFYKQIMLTFNPISEMHWLKQRFFPEYVEETLKIKKYASLRQEITLDDRKVNLVATVCHSTYRDNKFLPDEDRAQLEALKFEDEQYYNIYCLGQWGVIGNLVYPNGYEIIPVEQYPSYYDEVIYGLDFGYNNPTSLSRYGIVYRDEVGSEGIVKEYYIEELIYEKKLTNQDLIARMRELGIKNTEPIYADCAEPARIEELQRANEKGEYLFNVVPADKSVKDGIDYVKRCKMFSNPNNVNHNKEVKGYKWKEDQDGNPLDGEPVKFNDHTQDEKRYALYTHSKIPEMKMAFIQ